MPCVFTVGRALAGVAFGGWCCIWRLVFDLAVWVQLAAWVQLDRRNRVVVNLACGRDQQPRSAPPGDHRGISRGISW